MKDYYEYVDFKENRKTCDASDDPRDYEELLDDDNNAEFDNELIWDFEA